VGAHFSLVGGLLLSNKSEKLSSVFTNNLSQKQRRICSWFKYSHLLLVYRFEFYLCIEGPLLYVLEIIRKVVTVLPLQTNIHSYIVYIFRSELYLLLVLRDLVG
jgi:hypothetical protein